MISIRFDIPDTPFERVVTVALPEDFAWNDTLTLTAPGRSLTGAGSINAEPHALHGTVAYNDWDEWQQAAAAGVIEFTWAQDVAPGMFVGEGRVLEARPTEGDAWLGGNCIITGQSGLMEGELRFIIGELRQPGPAAGNEPAFIRLIWSGAHIEGPPHVTGHCGEERVEFTRDRVNGSFGQRQFTIRNMTHPQHPNEEFLAAVIECESLQDMEKDAIWLLASFLSGRRLRQTAMERYDKDGVLIDRRFLSGAPSSIGSFAPFHIHIARLRGEYLETIGSGFLRMLRAGFPIEVILHHLHNANEGDPETDAQSLLLSVHTAIEAWNRHFGIRHLADEGIFTHLRDALLELIQPVVEDLGPDLGEAVRNKLCGANFTSTGFRERDLLARLSITPTTDDKNALASRNRLLHNGYFLTRWRDLTDAQRQERIDSVGRLRNIVHRIILGLVGFDGAIVEATRYQNLRVSSTYCPLFVAREHPG